MPFIITSTPYLLLFITVLVAWILCCGGRQQIRSISGRNTTPRGYYKAYTMFTTLIMQYICCLYLDLAHGMNRFYDYFTSSGFTLGFKITSYSGLDMKGEVEHINCVSPFLLQILSEIHITSAIHLPICHMPIWALHTFWSLALKLAPPIINICDRVWHICKCNF